MALTLPRDNSTMATNPSRLTPTTVSVTIGLLCRSEEMIAQPRYPVSPDAADVAARRRRITSKHATAPAAATLRLPRAPNWGIAARAEHRRRVSAARPRPSAPITSATPIDASKSRSNSDVGASASRPTLIDPEVVQLPQRVRDTGYDGDVEVLDGTRRHLGHGRRHVHGAMARQHHAGDARALGTAQQRAHVVGIGDTVEDEEERDMSRSRPAQRLELDLLEGPGVGQDALGGIGARRAFEFGPGNEHQPDPSTRGEAFDVVDLRRRVEVFGDPDLAHRSTTRGQELAHGLAALDLLATQSVAAAGATRPVTVRRVGAPVPAPRPRRCAASHLARWRCRVPTHRRSL